MTDFVSMFPPLKLELEKQRQYEKAVAEHDRNLPIPEDECPSDKEYKRLVAEDTD